MPSRAEPQRDIAEHDARRPAVDRKFFVGLARAFGGAIFFSLPLLMTMEMWSLGASIHRLRLALFIALFVPVLVGLSRYSGFRETRGWTADVVDAFVAYAVGFVTSAIVLALFGVLDASMPAYESVGKVALEAVPASVGATLAVGQLGGGADRGDSRRRRRKRASYATDLFLMFAGAIFFAFNVAPTEEMILIAFKMEHWQVALLAVLSLAMMHAFVYAVEFSGQAEPPPGTPWWIVFLRFTVVGYAISLGVSGYVLWTLGRFDESGIALVLTATLVLGFPASLGAAAARLVL